jgi:hypothetical protein
LLEKETKKPRKINLKERDENKKCAECNLLPRSNGVANGPQIALENKILQLVLGVVTF